MRRSHLVMVALLLGASLAPAFAWKGAPPPGSVRPIAEVTTNAEEGDFVMVEGEITDVRSGEGGLRVAMVEDDTGEVAVAVAEYLRRGIEREPGENPIGARVRVTGKWDHNPLEQDRWGIRATAVERLPGD
jgi:RecJ-like exonuclease